VSDNKPSGRLRYADEAEDSSNRDMQKGTFWPYPLRDYISLGGGTC
jgi:hypothetical protein